MFINAIRPFNARVGYGTMKGHGMPARYTKVGHSFNSSDTSRELTKKYARYPMVIKGIVFLLPEYLQGKVSAKNFTEQYLDRTPVMMTKIELSKNGKDFEQKYNGEIALVKSLNTLCNDYNTGKITKREFDKSVEDHAKELLETTTPEIHDFSI